MCDNLYPSNGSLKRHHSCPSLLRRTLGGEHPGLSRVVEYDLWFDSLFVVFINTDIEDICSSQKSGEDSSTVIVSIAEI